MGILNPHSAKDQANSKNECDGSVCTCVCFEYVSPKNTKKSSVFEHAVSLQNCLCSCGCLKKIKHDPVVSSTKTKKQKVFRMPLLMGGWLGRYSSIECLVKQCLKNQESIKANRQTNTASLLSDEEKRMILVKKIYKV